MTGLAFGELAGLDAEFIDSMVNEYKLPEELMEISKSDYRIIDSISTSESESEASEKEDVPSFNKPKLNPNSILPIEIDYGYFPRIPDKCNLALEKLGIVRSIICNCLIIESTSKFSLDSGTSLFDKDGNGIGEIFEIFGPVPTPFYVVVCSNSSALNPPSVPIRRLRPDDYDRQKVIHEYFEKVKKIPVPDMTIGEEVFYAPADDILTLPVFMSQLKMIKGTDASWVNDTELPIELQDFSDDEAERSHKRKQKSKRKHPQSSGSQSFEEQSSSKINEIKREPAVSQNDNYKSKFKSNPWSRSYKQNYNFSFASHTKRNYQHQDSRRDRENTPSEHSFGQNSLKDSYGPYITKSIWQDNTWGGDYSSQYDLQSGSGSFYDGQSNSYTFGNSDSHRSSSSNFRRNNYDYSNNRNFQSDRPINSNVENYSYSYHNQDSPKAHVQSQRPQERLDLDAPRYSNEVMSAAMEIVKSVKDTLLNDIIQSNQQRK